MGIVRKVLKVLGIFAGVYVAGSALQAYYVSNKLENMRTDFRKVAQDVPSGLETKLRGGVTYRALDYNGMLDEKVQQRNRYLHDRGCFILKGSWYVEKKVDDVQAGDKLKVTVDDTILCYKPFPL